MATYGRREFCKLLAFGAAGIHFAGKLPLTGPAMIRPKKLNKGDTIGIIAPAASYFSQENLNLFIQKIEQLGFIPLLGKNINNRYGYLAGSDQERADDLNSMVANHLVKAIIAIRGGWGCARILPLLDFRLIAQNPKAFIGFSDITSLLNAITTKTGLVTYHGPVAVSDWENEFSLSIFEEVLIKGNKIRMDQADEKHPFYTITPGKASGQIFGGNLSVLSDMIGTPYLPSWQEKILFLEDVTEDIFRIDRMLTQMRLAGIFDQVAGIIFGTCEKCAAPEPEKSLTLQQVIFDNIKPCGKPAFFGLKIGHVTEKYIVPIGLPVEIDADKGFVRMLEHPVNH